MFAIMKFSLRCERIPFQPVPKTTRLSTTSLKGLNTLRYVFPFTVQYILYFIFFLSLFFPNTHRYIFTFTFTLVSNTLRYTFLFFLCFFPSAPSGKRFPFTFLSFTFHLTSSHMLSFSLFCFHFSLKSRPSLSL